MRSQWELGKRLTATAVRTINTTIITVTGDKPTPCHKVRLAPVPPANPLATPSEFRLEWNAGDEICTQVITPYSEKASTSNPAGSILLHHADGDDSIAVTIIQDQP